MPIKYKMPTVQELMPLVERRSLSFIGQWTAAALALAPFVLFLALVFLTH